MTISPLPLLLLLLLSACCKFVWVCLVILLRSGAKLEFCGMEMEWSETKWSVTKHEMEKREKNLKAQPKL